MYPCSVTGQWAESMLFASAKQKEIFFSTEEARRYVVLEWMERRIRLSFPIDRVDRTPEVIHGPVRVWRFHRQDGLIGQVLFSYRLRYIFHSQRMRNFLNL
jgi:hypothetical protein